MVLNLISEQQLISDRGKAVAFRDKDREALRRAIHEEMASKDYEAALVLADDMEKVFGYKQEAEQFRQDIGLKRNETARRQIAEAVGAVERCCRDEAWNEALTAADRIARLYPNDEQARELPQQVESRRMAHKKQLLESYQDAKRRNDVEAGVEILKRLDLYLTPPEAASMQEDARAMFRTKLHNLGEQFKAAYHEGRSAEAIRIGEQIVEDFPNSRMADEVKEIMPALQQRAARRRQHRRHSRLPVYAQLSLTRHGLQMVASAHAVCLDHRRRSGRRDCRDLPGPRWLGSRSVRAAAFPTRQSLRRMPEPFSAPRASRTGSGADRIAAGRRGSAAGHSG